MSNLISTVFYMEQQKGFAELVQGLKEVAATLTQLPKRDVHRFSTWASKIFAKELPIEQQEYMEAILTSNTGEVETMISNIERIIRETRVNERTLGKEEGIAKGKAEGIAEGEARGMLLGKKQAARNALKMGLSVRQTAKVTELPLAEVEALKKELSN
ncbi:MAG: hypothetical protein FH749_15815 [Firmicutes bacterium]|nr:hypothetical protein [Bacillota bacterium]